MREDKDLWLLGITDPDELEEVLAQLKIEDLEELAISTPADTFGDRRVFDDFQDRIGEDNDDYEPLDIEPVDPWDPERHSPTEELTEEELFSVLRSFEEVDETTTDDEVAYTAGDVLPELEFLESDESPLLDPAEFTASIFDTSTIQNRDCDESDSINQAQDELHSIKSGSEATAETAADENKGDLGEDDDDDLLEGLQKLNLDWQTDDDTEEIDDFDFNIPSYLFCQPCTPTGSQAHVIGSLLASITEDDEFLDPVAADLKQFEQEGRPQLPNKEFDSLLLHMLSGAEAEREMDSLFEKAASEAQQASADDSSHEHSIIQRDHTSPDHFTEHQDPTEEPSFYVSSRPEALDAAAPILASFVKTPSGLANERSCLGHKETIFGVSFSECGKYLASASQDSTVIVWDVATNKELATLREHSKDYECLRVAWYVPGSKTDSMHCLVSELQSL
jgi:WD40 repeat protein